MVFFKIQKEVGKKVGSGEYNELNCRYSEFEMFVVHQIVDVYWGP